MCATLNAFNDALSCDQDAKALYDSLGHGHRAAFHEWITEPPVTAERLARVAEAVNILAGRRAHSSITRRN
jgi:hypothetical protein